MKKFSKTIIAILAITTILTAGFMMTACGKKNPETPTPTELTVTMDSTLSITEGETKVLSFTSNVDVSELSVAWRSSDRTVVDFVKGSDGFATLTAKKVGTANMMLTIQKGTDTSTKKTLTCAVTVNEYKNDALRIVYSIAETTGCTIETNITEQGFKYNEDVSIKITPDKNYALSSITVGEEGSSTNYPASDFTYQDGSYTITLKANLKPSGDETTINVPITVTMQKMTFSTQIDSAVTINGLSNDGYLMGQVLELTASWVKPDDEKTKICAVYYNQKEIFADKDGKYTFTVDKAVNDLVVKTGVLKQDVEKIYTVSVNEKNETVTSFASIRSVSTRGILIATFGFDKATESKYQFGVRLYNEAKFIARIDLVKENDDFALINSANNTQKYLFKNGEGVQERLTNGTFGIGIERDGQTYNVWVTDGEEIVKALEDSFITTSNSWFSNIGSTPGASTPLDSKVTYRYMYYDGQQGIGDYMKPVANVTVNNATVEGVKTDDELTLWDTLTFTVTPEENYKVSAVKLYGEIITATSTENGVYTYTVVVEEPSKFDLVIETLDPTASATLKFTNEKSLNVEIVEGEKTSYLATDVIKIKVTSTDRLIVFKGIEQNGFALTAQDGVYTITLQAGENNITIFASSAVVTGKSSGVQKPGETETDEEINTLVDVESKIGESITSPSPFGTLATVLKFEEAKTQTAEKWRVDLRFYSTNNGSDFLPISIGKDKKGLCVSKRFEQSLYFNALGEGNYSEDGVLTALANGTYRLAIVKTANKTYTIYCDNGLGKIVKLGAINGLGNITDEQYFYKIAFGGTSDGIKNDKNPWSITCSIDWTWYDSITDAGFVLSNCYDLTIAPKVDCNAEQATVSGLAESYKYGDKVSFTVKPADIKYAIKKVTVNGQNYTPDKDGKVEFTFESYTLEIKVETIFSTVTPTVNTTGGGKTVNGLKETYNVGDTASFTVTAENSTVYVTLNGQTLTANNGTYTFTVGEKIELDILIIKNDKATVALDADTAFILSGVDTTVNYYEVQSVVSLTVALKDYSGYDKSTIVVTLNGTPITANEGTYQITLAGGLNTISVTATKFTKLEKVVASGTSKSNADTETGFASTSDNKTGVYVLKLKYTDITRMKNNDLCVMDIRTYTSSDKKGFYPVGSLIWSEDNGFSFTTNRNVNSVTSFGTENSDAIFEKLEAGTYTVVIVNDSANENNLIVYAENGKGTLIKIGETKKTFNAYYIGFSQWNSGDYAFGSTNDDKFINTACGYSAYYYADITDFTVCPELAGFTVSAE